MNIQQSVCRLLLLAGLSTVTLNPLFSSAQSLADQKKVLNETALRPESSAPPEVASTLRTLRAGIAERKATFTVGYTPALAIPLSSLAGLKIPADVNDALIQSVNARAEKLESIDQQSAINSHVPIQIAPAACKATSASFDWRKLNAHLPPVRSQCCGDCWDHAANEVFDDSWAIRNNQSIETSVQYALDCFSAGTCAGGWYMPVFDKIMSQGTALESVVPTNCATGSCPNVAHPYRAVAWGFVNNSANIPTPAQIKTDLCAHGPLATAVEADSAFQAYTGGVFDEHSTHFTNINHAITIIGWDDNKVGANGNRGAWLIKNSWGSGWGETGEYGASKGYMWISYNTNNIGLDTAWVDAVKTKYVLLPSWINQLKLDKSLVVQPMQMVPK
jgi:cathepsin L